MNMTSDTILDRVWKGEGSIFSLIPPKQFRKCSWSELKQIPYAVLSYQWRTDWKLILKYISDPNGVKAEYIWIDIFCLNQLDGDRMTTILKSNEIYLNAREYHLIEIGSLFRGWILFELSSVRKGFKPTIHTSITEKKLLIKLKEEFHENGFEGCEFTKSSDKVVVRDMINVNHGSVKKFNDLVMEIINECMRDI